MLSDPIGLWPSVTPRLCYLRNVQPHQWRYSSALGGTLWAMGKHHQCAACSLLHTFNIRSACRTYRQPSQAQTFNRSWTVLNCVTVSAIVVGYGTTKPSGPSNQILPLISAPHA